MRKLWKGLLALSLCISLSACSKDSNEENTDYSEACEMLNSTTFNIEKVDFNIDTKDQETTEIIDIKDNIVYYDINHYYTANNTNDILYESISQLNLSTKEVNVIQDLSNKLTDYTNFSTAFTIYNGLPLYYYAETVRYKEIDHLMYGDQEILTVEAPEEIYYIYDSKYPYIITAKPVNEESEDDYLYTFYRFDGDLEIVKYENPSWYYSIWENTDQKLVYRKENYEQDGQSIFYNRDGELKSFYIPYSTEPYFFDDSISIIGDTPVGGYDLNNYFTAVVGDYIITIQKIGEDEPVQVICNMNTGIKTEVKVMYLRDGELVEDDRVFRNNYYDQVLSSGNNMFIFIYNTHIYKAIIDEENQTIIYTKMEDPEFSTDGFVQYFNNNDGTYYCLFDNETIAYDENNYMTKEGSLDLYHITVDSND